ncbi:MAG: hypothetical protein L3J74_01755 [Bacteroidales bacterium]|nr:hypothetical protein [Bacteroidales bacterium]
MKKISLYIILFATGVVLGFYFFQGYNVQAKKNYLAVDKPVHQQEHNFRYSALSMLGRNIILNGKIEEAYKNKNNEMVLYIDVEHIPVKVSCTLINTEKQIKIPVKLGEQISIKGNFMCLDERMELKKCLILQRENE